MLKTAFYRTSPAFRNLNNYGVIYFTIQKAYIQPSTVFGTYFKFGQVEGSCNAVYYQKWNEKLAF